MILFIFLMIMFAAFAWLISAGMIMLVFYPKNPIRLLGLYWESPMLTFVKKLDWNNILPKEQIPEQLEALMPVIDEKLDDFFRNRLSEKLPMISMFIGDKTIQQLKEVFIEELRTMFPELIHSFTANIQKDLVNKLQPVYIDVMQKKLWEAAAPIRKLALLMGILWGAITYLILSIF